MTPMPPFTDELDDFRARFGTQLGFHGAKVVAGGTIERWETVRNALAAVPGGALGGVLGREALERLTGAGVVPAGFVFHSGWVPLVSAIGAALLVGVLASRIAVRRAARSRPASARASASPCP